MTAVRVGLVGAAGETGTSIVDGLLEAGDFVSLPTFPRWFVFHTSLQELVALTRSASVPKPGNKALKQRGVEVRPVDLQGPQEKLVGALQGIDIVVSAIRSIGSAQPDRFGHCTEVGRCEEVRALWFHHSSTSWRSDDDAGCGMFFICPPAPNASIICIPFANSVRCFRSL